MLPSATDTSAIDSDGGGGAASSLEIVTVALDVPSVNPPVGLDSATVNVSLTSTVVSPSTVSVIVALVAPAANVTVPDAAV